MSIESITVQYREYRRDIKSFPKGTSMYDKLDKQIKDFLKSVKERFGQEMVDRLTKPPRVNIKKILKKKIVICLICRHPVAERNLARHMHFNHENKIKGEAAKCPVCKVKLRKKILEKHIKKVHS